MYYNQFNESIGDIFCAKIKVLPFASIIAQIVQFIQKITNGKFLTFFSFL